MRYALSLLILTAPIFGLIGCSSADRPTIAFSSARITEETDAGMVISFVLDATNTNDFDVPLERVRYTLELGGEEVFSGTRSAEATIRRLGTQQITLPAAIDLTEHPAPTGETPYVLAGSIVYVTPGEIAELLFDAGVRRPRMVFRHEGVLDFDEGAAALTDEPTDQNGTDSSVE